jgi:cell wall-associated NlpC family hydrolase
MNYSNKLVWVISVVMVFSSCALFKKQPRKPTTVTDLSFYEEHSRVLGFPLSGNEDPDLIKEVVSWLGVPYMFGGNSRAGADCSGMVQQVFLTVYSLALPRSSSQIADYSRRVRKTQLVVGDLVFFETSSRRKINHVGIYLGSNKFIHSSTSRGVIVSDLDEPYWKKTYSRSGRVL